MPKTLFDDELTFSGAHLRPTGRYEDDGYAPTPAIVYWLVTQGDREARGVCKPVDGRWEGAWIGDEPWEEGPANAVALAAVLTRDGALTYSWWMPVTLKAAMVTTAAPPASATAAAPR